MSGVANAFARTDVVPPVMSRKHAEILFAHDEVSQCVDLIPIGLFLSSNWVGLSCAPGRLFSARCCCCCFFIWLICEV